LKPVIFTLYVKARYSICKPKTRAVLHNKATGIAQHMAYVVQNNTDVLVLTVFADLKLVAVYSVYHMIAFSLRSIVTSFTGGMEAVFGNMIAKGEKKELLDAYKRYKFILSFLTLTVFGTAAALIVPFVMLYTHGTTDVDYSRPVFAILILLSEAINCLILPCFNLPIAANKLKESQLGAYSEAAINLVLSIALVFWNPLVGIALGTLLSSVFKAFYYMMFSAKHVLGVKPARIIADFLVIMAGLVIVSAVGMTVASTLPLYNYTRWVAGGFVTVAATGAVSLVVSGGMYSNVVKLLFGKIKRG
jgi:O-antigen/teichoic acid export membrane protein